MRSTPRAGPPTATWRRSAPLSTRHSAASLTPPKSATRCESPPSPDATGTPAGFQVPGRVDTTMARPTRRLELDAASEHARVCVCVCVTACLLVPVREGRSHAHPLRLPVACERAGGRGPTASVSWRGVQVGLVLAAGSSLLCLHLLLRRCARSSCCVPPRALALPLSSSSCSRSFSTKA
eukprot:3660439-Rhodomonas_salina.2